MLKPRLLNDGKLIPSPLPLSPEEREYNRAVFSLTEKDPTPTPPLKLGEGEIVSEFMSHTSSGRVKSIVSRHYYADKIDSSLTLLKMTKHLTFQNDMKRFFVIFQNSLYRITNNQKENYRYKEF